MKRAQISGVSHSSTPPIYLSGSTIANERHRDLHDRATVSEGKRGQPALRCFDSGSGVVSKQTDQKEKPHTRTGRTVIGSAILILRKPIKHSETRQLQTAKEKQQHAEQHGRWRSIQTAAGMGRYLHTDTQHQKHEDNDDHGGTASGILEPRQPTTLDPPLCASSGAIFCLLQQPPRKFLTP